MRSLIAIGETEKALHITKKLRNSGDESPFAKACRLLENAMKGQIDQSVIYNDSSFFDWAKRDAEWAQFIYDTFALTKLDDLAIEWLENAFNVGFINYPFLANYNPFLKELRKQKRFQELLKKIESEWRAFENEIVESGI